MRNLLSAFGIALLSFTLCGCPYESHVPIDTPSVPVETALLGKWKTSSESYSEYEIAKENAMQYRVVQHAMTGDKHQYLAHLSQVKNGTFLNLYSDSTGTYYLYRVKLDNTGKKLTLMPFHENLSEHFGSSAGLKTYVEQHMNLQSFYNDTDREEFEKVQ